MRAIRLSTARNGVYRAKNKLPLARVGLVNFAGGPEATCILYPSPLSLLLCRSLVLFPSVRRGSRSRSFRRGVPRMSSPEKARKSLHLPRASCPYLERKYANPDSSKARRTLAFTRLRLRRSIVRCEFFNVRSYIIRTTYNYRIVNVTALPPDTLKTETILITLTTLKIYKKLIREYLSNHI